MDSTLSSNTPGYIREHYTDFASSPTEETFLKDKDTDQFTSRLKGYFVPPNTDSYRFYVRSDDKSLVYFSNNSSPANKVRNEVLSTKLNLSKLQGIFYFQCPHDRVSY